MPRLDENESRKLQSSFHHICGRCISVCLNSMMVAITLYYAGGNKNTLLRLKTEVVWRHVKRVYL